MLHHVSVGVRDVARAAAFYDPVLKALGYRRVAEYLPHAVAYGERKSHPEFWIGVPHNQQMATAGNGTHVGFLARTKAQVEAFHAAALKAGGSNDGEPGPRPDYGPEYYGAFIYDLDGNKIEATLRILVSEAAEEEAPEEKKELTKAERIAARKARLEKRQRRAKRKAKLARRAKRLARKGKKAQADK
jgi:catechol 2,3-dioxygenase-like lactoylglutathione lyase family enzyme